MEDRYYYKNSLKRNPNVFIRALIQELSCVRPVIFEYQLNLP